MRHWPSDPSSLSKARWMPWERSAGWSGSQGWWGHGQGDWHIPADKRNCLGLQWAQQDPRQNHSGWVLPSHNPWPRLKDGFQRTGALQEGDQSTFNFAREVKSSLMNERLEFQCSDAPGLACSNHRLSGVILMARLEYKWMCVIKEIPECIMCFAYHPVSLRIRHWWHVREGGGVGRRGLLPWGPSCRSWLSTFPFCSVTSC